MYNQEIFFLGSDRDSAESLAKFLCPLPEEDHGSVKDLSDILMILPGRQAVRAVTRELSALHKIILVPAFSTSSSFRNMGVRIQKSAPSPVEKKILWMQVIREVSCGEFPELFPEELIKTEQTLSVLSDQILTLRRELELKSDSLTFSKVNELLNGSDRNFPALAELEKRYLEKLASYDMEELFQHREDPLEEARYFLKYRRIIIGACPDLPPFAREKLSRLRENFEILSAQGYAVPQIQICICASGQWRDHFDSWGCLIPEQWRNTSLSFRKNTVHSVMDVREMGLLAAKLALCTREDGKQYLDCADTAVVVTDPAFFSELESAFSVIRTGENKTLRLYNPDGVSMKDLRLVQFCSSLCDLISGEKMPASAVRAFLNLEYVLACFAYRYGISRDELLKAVDAFYLVRLPDVISIQDLPAPDYFAEYSWQYYSTPDEACRALEILIRIFRDIRNIGERLQTEGKLIENLREICSEIFCFDSIEPKYGIDLEDEAVLFREVCAALEKSPVFRGLPPEEGLQILIGELSREKLYAEHSEEALEITGFLDMPFRKASRVILCGMSEGLLPERSSLTPYLNDELRKILSLPDSDTKYARDCFYVKMLLDRTGGNVHFISPKMAADNSVLGFSSLYFSGQKDPREFLTLCGVLFENYPLLKESSASRQIPFHAGLDLTMAFRQGERTVLNVTAFADLLRGPLNAALQNIAGLDETDYGFPELDFAVQGTVVHKALQHFVLREEWITAARSGDPVRKAAAQKSASEALYLLFVKEMQRRCGREDMALLPKIQMERWEIRISKTAEKLLEGSCPVLETEWKLNGGNGIEWVDSVWIKGTIDRIEYDEENNMLRLIDFKTGSKTDPAAAHLAGRDKKYFINLQLPLYKMLLRKDPVFRKKYPRIDLDHVSISCGYFTLSSVTAEIGYYFWPDMDQYDETAEQTVSQVIRLVKMMQSGTLPEIPGSFGEYDPGKNMYPYGYMATFGPWLPMEEFPEEKISFSVRKESTGKKRKGGNG